MLKMIPLPYPLNALEPYYSAETLRLHYEILYKGYVDNTNKTEEKLKNARHTNDFSTIKCLEKDLSFYGSGAILHELFFENMGATVVSEPNAELMQQILQDFGSYEAFKNQFTRCKYCSRSIWLVFTCMGSSLEYIKNTSMRKTPKPHSLGLHTSACFRHVGTFLLFAIPNQKTRLRECFLEYYKLELRK